KVAQSHRSERANVVRLARDQEAAEFTEVGRDREFVDLALAAAFGEQRERLARMGNETRRMRGDANVVEAVVGEQRARRIPSVARHAASLAVEGRPST